MTADEVIGMVVPDGAVCRPFGWCYRCGSQDLRAMRALRLSCEDYARPLAVGSRLRMIEPLLVEVQVPAPVQPWPGTCRTGAA